MAFARRKGLSLSEVFNAHPRDIDTWLALDQVDEQEQRFAELHRQRQG